MPKFVKIAVPLQLLLKKSTVFQWISEHSVAFEDRKEALTHALVLAYPQFKAQHPLSWRQMLAQVGLEPLWPNNKVMGKYVAFLLTHSL